MSISDWGKGVAMPQIKHSLYDRELQRERDKEMERRQFELQMKQIQHLHEIQLAQKAAEQEAAKQTHMPSNPELICRIMEMQKKYIDRLELENARLNETITRLTSNVVVPKGD